MVRRKKIVEGVSITGIADKGMSIGRDEEGKVYFVEGVVPGDVADVLVLRKKKGFSRGVAKNITQLSRHRVQAFCDHFPTCGGCKWQHLDYAIQLEQKEQIVKDAMSKIGGLDQNLVTKIVGSEKTRCYRNKLEYSFSNKRWLTDEEIRNKEEIIQEPALGFHKAGAFDKIVPIDKCHLQDDYSNNLRNFVDDYCRDNELSYYDYREHQGLMRNMTVRNTTVGDWMVLFSFGRNEKESIKNLLENLLEKFSKISSLQYVINEKVNDTIYDLEVINYYGPGYIEEQMREVKFRIGPKSFFQTNTTQAKVLFDIAIGHADITSADIVYDLYSGVGSIGLYLARSCKSVVGIETVAEAVQAAQINQELNGIENATYVCGDVRDILKDSFVDTYGSPDVIVTDPPRAGMHPDVVKTLLEIGASRLIYISCNPATQARDLSSLKDRYDVTTIQPVDMFPHTSHIECITTLRLKT